MGGECESYGGLALLHLTVRSRGWLCGWLYQPLLFLLKISLCISWGLFGLGHYLLER